MDVFKWKFLVLSFKTDKLWKNSKKKNYGYVEFSLHFNNLKFTSIQVEVTTVNI